MNDEFYMVIPSDNCRHFKMTLDREIRLDGNWEVALHELSIINTPFKISYKLNVIVNVRMSLMVINGKLYGKVQNITEDKKFRIFEKGKRTVIKAPSNNFLLAFRSRKEAENFGFTNVYNNATRARLTSPKDRKEGDVTGIAYVSYDGGITEEKEFKFPNSFRFNDKTDLIDYIQKNCTEIFMSVGVTNKVFNFLLQRKINEITFDSGLAYTLGLSTNVFPNFNLAFYYASDLIKLKPVKNIFIYTNLIVPIIVGNVRAPLLKAIILPDVIDSSTVMNFEIKNRMYFSILNYDINNIEFEIRDDSGTLINFGANSRASITIHFKRHG